VTTRGRDGNGRRDRDGDGSLKGDNGARGTDTGSMSNRGSRHGDGTDNSLGRGVARKYSRHRIGIVERINGSI
jgi:hypothetical protein